MRAALQAECVKRAKSPSCRGHQYVTIFRVPLRRRPAISAFLRGLRPRAGSFRQGADLTGTGFAPICTAAIRDPALTKTDPDSLPQRTRRHYLAGGASHPPLPDTSELLRALKRHLLP